MKIYALTLLIMGFSMITKAQYFMGNTESEIIKAYSNKKYKMEIKDLSSNSKQIRFLHEETNISYDYFLRDGICSMHILIAPRKALLPFIKDLNETNIKVDDNIWMDKSNTGGCFPNCVNSVTLNYRHNNGNTRRL